MSHVDFKKLQCRVSLSLIFPISQDEFKEMLCHPVDFRGQGPRKART